MNTRQHPLTPLAAVAGGILAGAAGTAVMDAVLYARYRRTGGKEAPLAWEFPPTENWQKASDPGQVVKRVIEGFTQRPIPDRWARPATIAAHWAFGSAAAAAYGVVAGRCAVRGRWTESRSASRSGRSATSSCHRPAYTSRSGSTTSRRWPRTSAPTSPTG